MLRSFEDWLKDNPAPDLQALAAEFGGLGNVPDERMEQFVQASKQWRDKVRWRHEERVSDERD